MEHQTPAWRSEDSIEAVKAVEEISDTELLAQIAAEAPTKESRLAAIKKMKPTESQALLAGVAESTEEDSEYEPGALEAVKKISDQTLLARVAKDAHSECVRKAAIKKLIPEQHQPLLAELAEAGEQYYDLDALEAVKKLTDQTLLANVAVKAESPDVREAAVEKLIPEQHRALLQEIMEEDDDEYVRDAASAKLNELD
ncbi:MAG: hypothetical protein LBH04_05100 [Tannerellaceae bacterium]|jgi:hypothetical protein|nr:hypothetical protein [Tannerellaceae bacterium]